jgi:heme-degrading monooxygenase HmoA
VHTIWARALPAISTRVWFPWTPGPEARTDAAVVVSLTEFTMHSRRTFPGIARAGRRLGLGWYAVPGAVGVYLWADPLHRRTGALSIWTDLAAMRRWVGLPLHVATVRRYRTRGSVRSTTWHAENADRAAIVAEATRILDGQRGR